MLRGGGISSIKRKEKQDIPCFFENFVVLVQTPEDELHKNHNSFFDVLMVR